MEELFRTNDPALIAFASAMLSGEDIAVQIFDVHTSILEGSLGFLPRRVMVPRTQLEKARAILRDLKDEIGEELQPGPGESW
ncbi:MAG: DUF2007 domain-containing protein [Neomegalonema sp.]|nr:DUF2007 domain-containing protein [Neomegalonema sp.]